MDALENEANPTQRAPRRRHSIGERIVRSTDAFFDAVGLRPLGIVVFAASAFALTQLLGMSISSVRADAVATARVVDHPSRVGSFATTVFVSAGDPVDVGTPLVELSPHFIDRDLLQLSQETEQLINESQLAQAKLLVDEERWLSPSLRQMPKRPSLEGPTEAFFAKQLEVLHARRESLLQDRAALTVRSSFKGIVAEITWPGAWVSAGASVAKVMPEFAEEIVAYIPPGSSPEMISDDAAVYIVGSDLAECRSAGRVQRRGASVVEAPGQLTRMFRFALHGMPIHVSIPENCSLGNGQTLTLDFRLETS